MWKGGEEEGFSGHGTLLGHTYQNEAYAVPEEEGALGMGQVRTGATVGFRPEPLAKWQ